MARSGNTGPEAPVLTFVNTPTYQAGPLTIEVWSDVVCPWCYIGKRRLEAALDLLASDLERHGTQAEPNVTEVERDGTQVERHEPDDIRDETDDIRVVWRAFQLDPSSPRPGEAGHGQGVAEHLGQKYGGGLQAGLAMSAQMTQVAAQEGLDFHLEDAGRGNTLEAHRLLHLAADLTASGAAGLQDRVKERLLLAYFTQGQDVSDPDVLRTLVAEAGLPAEHVERVLGSDDYAQAVSADQQQAQAYGATGVPFTVIDGRYAVSGAQPVEVFAEAIRRALADRQPRLVTVDAGATGATGEACGPQGC